jgi:hypothetical protein
MRAAFVCDRCKARSADKPYLASKEFADVVSILNAVSLASRRGVDILSESPATGADLKSNANVRFDVFLCHNSQDKPTVRLLNERKLSS